MGLPGISTRSVAPWRPARRGFVKEMVGLGPALLPTNVVDAAAERSGPCPLCGFPAQRPTRTGPPPLPIAQIASCAGGPPAASGAAVTPAVGSHTPPPRVGQGRDPS